MKAAVMYETGTPEVLRIERRPVPTPQSGEVLIRVKAFGLNPSEARARQGGIPMGALPRILGIEAIGVVEETPGNGLTPGDIVATSLGGMGYDVDGSYAEYTCVPATQVQVLKTDLPWEQLAALPHLLLTAWESLFWSLRIELGERLLIRDGTSTLGLAAASLAKHHGALVSATTRTADRQKLLRASGVDQVFIDSGQIADQVREVYPRGVDKVLELSSAHSLGDSLRCAKAHGIVCLVDVQGDTRSMGHLSLMETIPTAVQLTTFTGTADDFMRTPLDELAALVANGALRVPVAAVFSLDDIVASHRWLEANEAGEKGVVLT